MTTKTVLILTDEFPPGFAPRMGYLSKYLAENSWKGIAISTVSNERSNFDFLSGYIPCEKICFSKQQRKSILKKMIGFFFPQMRGPWGAHKKMKYLTKKIISKEQIDIILSSTSGSLFSHSNACKIAKKYKTPWIADLRDIYEQFPAKRHFLNELYLKISIRKRNQLLKTADTITTVSKRHVEILSNYGLKAHCIYNGADTEIFLPAKYHNLDKFRIVYTGRMGTTTRDVSPLFSAIQQLFIDGDIDSNNCRIQFYTNFASQKIVNEQKMLLGVSDFIDCFNFVSATEIPKILNGSSILLLLLNGGSEGIMTTKFFEYLAVGRPILCIQSNIEYEGEVNMIINNSDAGIAAKSIDDIKLFIKSKYKEWLKTGYTNSNINWDYIKNFTRAYSAKQFVELFDTILDDKNKA